MLTDTKIKRLKPQIKTFKETDSNGLYLEVRPTGKRFFRFRYRHPQTRKEQVLTIGEYPAVSLQQAREQRNQAKELLAQGMDPNEHKQEAKQSYKQVEQEKERLANRMTFEQLFREWHKHNSQSERNPSGWSYAYAKDTRQRIEKWLLPSLGDRPIEEVTPREVISALKAVEAGGALETLKRLKQYAGRMYKYAIGLGYCEWNPAADLPSDIFAKQQKTNYAHLTNSAELQQLFRSIESYCGDISTKAALIMAPYVFLRPKELAALEWAEVDLKKGVIEIKADRMKKKRAHLIPISEQVRSQLEEQARYSGGSRFVFRSPRTASRPISEQSLNAALHRLGFKGLQTVHGFRHTASTLLNELGFNGDWIEKQLAHEQINQVRATYNKAQYLKERVRMVQAYANHLDSIKAGADVVPLHGRLKG